LLSQTCIALGEHLANLLTNRSHKVETKTSASEKSQRDESSIELRREALNAFADGASYGAHAESYELVIHATRHFWNLCIVLLKKTKHRALLYDNLTDLLVSLQNAYKFKPAEVNQSLNSTMCEVNTNKPNSDDIATNVKKSNKKNDLENKNKNDEKQIAGLNLQESNTKKDKEKSRKHSSKTLQNDKTIENSDNLFNNQQPKDAFDDLTLRCALYACLFQILIDKAEFQEALEQMEHAINVLPRTKHRSLIYRFKVLTKSRLGLDVQMDLQKFKDDSEKNLAHMYRRVALSSVNCKDTIVSYQRAIETLKVSKFYCVFLLNS
jgi:hypothetical protein